jgi:hypothetical protein
VLERAQIEGSENLSIKKGPDKENLFYDPTPKRPWASKTQPAKAEVFLLDQLLHRRI